MKIVTVIGARPQFIKAAAVSRAIVEINAGLDEEKAIKEVIVHTGQHFDANMSEIFFTELKIPTPTYNLEIDSLSHGAMTGRMLEKIEEILFRQQPDFVMVYGDTNSTLAGALAAKKNGIKVVHVEAGLRSRNMNMPEEINRVLTDRISDILCCPTDNAVENLMKEGYMDFPCVVEKTGDVMLDAALFYSSFSKEKSTIVSRLRLEKCGFILCTIHRAENTNDPVRLENIISALNEISRKIRVILPLHPRTGKIIAKLDITPKFEMLDPVGYYDMIELLKHAKIVVTDSGGMQKEAYFFKKFCLTLRDETEWVELLKQGANRLVGADKDTITSAVDFAMNDSSVSEENLYGEGVASRNIVKLLCREFSS